MCHCEDPACRQAGRRSGPRQSERTTRHKRDCHGLRPRNDFVGRAIRNAFHDDVNVPVSHDNKLARVEWVRETG